MAQLSETRRQLCEDKKKIEENNTELQKKVESLSLELNECQLKYERQISNESVRHMKEIEGIRKSLNEQISFLQTTLNTAQVDKENLAVEVAKLKEQNRKHLHIA